MTCRFLRMYTILNIIPDKKIYTTENGRYFDLLYFIKIKTTVKLTRLWLPHIYILANYCQNI